jgi:hypothetical protein
MGCLVGHACAVASWGTLSAAKVKAKPMAVLNVRRCMQVTPKEKLS